MRRRFVVLVFGVVFALVGGVASARPSNIEAGMVKVKSGRWGGVPWSFAATDANGDLCMAMAIGGPRGSSGCGLLPLSRGDGSSGHGLRPMSDNGGFPDYVAGAVIASAREVVITLSNGTVLRTPTIPARPGLPRGISFFVTQKPCGPTPVAVVALNATGRIVARAKLRLGLGLHFPPSSRIAC